MAKQKHIKLVQLICIILLATKNLKETTLDLKLIVSEESKFDPFAMIA
jgi:hypothetical protein